MNLQDKQSVNQNNEKSLNAPVSRRDMIKAGGLLALGLAYSKPFVETVKAKPAFDGNY